MHVLAHFIAGVVDGDAFAPSTDSAPIYFFLPFHSPSSFGVSVREGGFVFRSP